MKAKFLISIAASLLLVGCSDNSSNSASSQGSSDENPLDAPANYLKTVTSSEQKAVKVVDVTSLNSAIQMFNVSEGRFPKDLNELVEKKYFPRIPAAPAGSKIVYDATSGTVRVVKQ
jgi:ABC-type Fe3+-hydroxamate transport system substrate-binding protein